MPRRKKTIGPVGFAIRRLAADIGDRNVGGKVFVLAAKCIACPCTGAGKPLGIVTGVHKHAARTVCVSFAVHRMAESDVVDVLRHVGKHRGDFLAALARGNERPGAFHQVAVLPLERHQPLFAGHGFAMVFFQRGFVFPQVHVRGGTRAEDLQDSFGFDWVMSRAVAGRPGCRLFSRRRCTQEMKQADPTESRMDVSQKMSPSDRRQWVH